MGPNPSNKRKIQNLLSIITCFIGFVLMAFMIVVEDEPGALPLALIIAGTGWYLYNRYKIRSQQT